MCRVPNSPQPCQDLFSIFLNTEILVGVNWHLTVLLICISLTITMLSIFMCLIPFHIFFEKNVYSSPVFTFLIGCLSFYCWILVFYIFWILNPYQICDLQYFLSFCRLSFTLMIESFDAQKLLILMKFNLLLPLLLKTPLLNPNSWRFFRFLLEVL